MCILHAKFSHRWEMQIREADCINGNILVVILYYSIARYVIVWNWVKGTWDLSVLFLMPECESINISVNFLLKKLGPR